MGYPKQVYDCAWALLRERARQNKEIVESRKAKIRAEIPEIFEIERLMSVTAAKSIYSAAAGDSDVKEKIYSIARENLLLQQKRRELLKNSGYPEDYLEEKHFCRTCSDKGYVGAKMCHCFEELLRVQAFSMISDFPGGSQPTFADFDLSFYADEPDEAKMIPRVRMTEIFNFCKQYADSFTMQSPSLLMMGKTGLGKTHLSLSIATKVIAKGYGVVYSPIQRLCDRMENSKFSYLQEAKDKYAQELDSVLKCDLLVLDDLGTEFSSTFSSSLIGNIINTRLIENKPTIVNTNLDLKGLEKQYSQRIASRLGFSYKVLAFIGDDIRFLMRTNRNKNR